jgi:hypothetical protein
MSKPRSERARWTPVFRLVRPHDSQRIEIAQNEFDQMLAVAKAFDAVGRVVRVEPAKYGQAVELKARRA